MYESVKKILDKSKVTGEDVLVARDMCIAEAEDSNEDAKLRAAGELIEKHYHVIVKCRKVGDEESVRRLCGLAVDGTPADIRAFIDEIMKEEV